MRLVRRMRTMLAGLALALACARPHAADAGTAKTVRGDVWVEYGPDHLRLSAGDRSREGDRTVVSEGGNAGISLQDEALISIGPGSSMLLDRFAFNSRTRGGGCASSPA